MPFASAFTDTFLIGALKFIMKIRRLYSRALLMGHDARRKCRKTGHSWWRQCPFTYARMYINEAYVRQLGRELVTYYHEDRTHLGLEKAAGGKADRTEAGRRKIGLCGADRFSP